MKKGTIVKAIREQGLFTLDEVRKCTKASGSCGSCTGLVEQILMMTAGAGYTAAPKLKPVCGCTDANHQQVRDAIREQHLLTIAAVYEHLNWRTPNGCASCRPAINYYLISTWPHEALDDPQSRFINERAHANIQKNGTFSVVPRMWAGETNASELRRIADVVDKYRIPTVKVTGGQRIDLLGVKKEDLTAVWKDLGMPSGHAYGKTLRTVKTCVGSEWCRFGTQDSTRMGKELERALWRMYAPHKVKLAVSGCPRNCAESGIKDVGVIGVDSGWEIYVAGNGGIKTDVAQFLCKVATHEEVLEVSAAFLQLYREEGWYLERTVHYVGRVGLDHVKAKVLEDRENRSASPSGCASRSTACPTPGSSTTRRMSTCASSRRSRSEDEEPAMHEWKVICRVDDIPRLGARKVTRQSGGDIAVFRTAEDKVFALLDKCPHKGGPLSQGIVFGESVACPLHNWTIGLADGCAAAPDVGCAQRFSVRVEDGAVALDLAELAAARRPRPARDARSRPVPHARSAIAHGRHPLDLPVLRRRLRRDHRDRGRGDHRRARRSGPSGQLRPPLQQGQHPAPHRDPRGDAADAAAPAAAPPRARRRAAADRLGRGARPRRRPLRRDDRARTVPTRWPSTSPASS